MPQVTGTVTTTLRQQNVLDTLFLPRINAARVAEGLAPLANMDAYADWLLEQSVLSWIKMSSKNKAREVGDEYDLADDDTRAQIDALLDPTNAPARQ